MSPAFRRSRAEKFATQVELDQTAEQPDELLALVGAMRGLAPVEPRTEFSADLRERLMTAAPAAMATSTRDAAVPRKTTTRRHHERRLTVAVGALAIVGATTASAIASSSALPGDTLYPVKRAIENLQTDVTVGDKAKGATVLSQAGDRLDEVTKLQRKGADPSDMKQALKAYADQASQASQLLLGDFRAHGDAASIAKLQAFTDEGIQTLGGLVGTLPPDLDGALTDATQTLLDIVAQASHACPSCDLGVLDLPSTLVNLVSGSVPAAASSGADSSAQTKSTDGDLPQGPIGPVTEAQPSSPGADSTTPADPKPSDKSSKAPKLPNPLGDHTGIIGGSNPLLAAPTSMPTSLGDAVDGVTNGLGGAVSGLGSALPGPIGGTVDGLGQTVGGVGKTLNGLLGGTPAP